MCVFSYIRAAKDDFIRQSLQEKKSDSNEESLLLEAPVKLSMKI